MCGVCAAPLATPTTPVTPVTPSTPQGTRSKERKEVEAGVRSHIEALVEGQVGGPLDPVSASPTTAHPLQRRLFSTHHAALSTAIAKLSYSLQMSILNRPLPPEELPTTRHAHLTDRVTQVLRDAMILPRQMESYDPAVSPETPVEDFNSHTYEDILATAILNKVLESCEGKRPDEVTIEVSHDVASTDTDSGMSGGAKESRRGRHKSEAGSEGSEERSLTPPARHTPAHRPPTASPDQGVVTDECWGPAYAAHDAPLQFKIEEHVEEVTTHHVTDEDEDDDGDASDSGSWRGSRGSLEDRKRTRRHKKVTQHSVTQDPLVSCLPVALPDPNQVTSRRVSFPELGRDIIQDSCSDTECCTVSPSDMVVEADSWEENWLFRRQRLAGVNNSDPITMLIPNPEAHITPTVGNRDVDELSELSEQRSVCSSEPWSDSDGEGEGLYSCSPNAASRELSLLAGEIVAEFGQQDQEYTVDYSAASRMAARRTPPPHSPSYSKPSRPHSLPQHTRHPMEASREHHNGRPVRGTSRDSESVSDTERPVPKPRKLSLATTPSSKASDKSPGKPLSSPMEDLTILSPPLDVPLPSEAKSSSETVWFVETPQDCIVLQGRTLRLSCVLNTKRPMGLTWYHNGSLVQSGGQEVWAWRRGPTHHLHLYNMTPAAAGVYAAAAYTASHCVWAFCRVHYKASARPAKQPTFTKGLTDAAVEECGELTLQCQVQGHPEPRVTFSRGTQQLQPSSRLAIESDQYGTWTLRLSDCALADAGQVTATASNTLASATCRCQVKVFPEGTSLPRQDASRSSRQHQSQSNQQLKGRSGSKPTQRTPHPGPHLSDNTARTPSTAALTTPSHLQLEDSLTTSSGAKSGGGEQEDILQVPTKPGTAPGKPDDLDGALEELHDTIVEETQRSPLLLLSNTASASEASVHEELDAIDSGVGGGGGGSGVGAAAVSVRQSGQGSSKHQHHLFNIAEEASDLAACGGESFPFAPVHGASLDLDYYPSSHDDNTSSSSSSDTDNNEDGKELTLIRPSDYLNSTSSAHQIPQTNLPALPSTLPPNQLHASSSLEDPCLQKHESCPRDSPSSGSPSDAPQTATGTIAEREHRKWEAAVPLPNNPYSPERLAHRLSHTRPPDHAIYTRSSSVEVDLDPSLQDGIPCRADLNRYSRDYYVAGGTNGTAAARSRSNFVNHQKHGQEHSQTFKPQHLTNGCHTPPNTSQQVTRNGQVCHTVPQIHVAAPCMSIGGTEASKVPISPHDVCPPNSHHPSPSSPAPSDCSVSDNVSSTVNRSKGRESLSVEPGKLHSSIIDRFDKSRASLPSSSVTWGSNRSLRQESMLSIATPVTQPDSHNPLCEKTRQSVSMSSPSTMSSPFSSLVTPLLPESPGIGELEGNFIHHNLTRLSFRSRKTTREFSLNPLFEDEDRGQGGDSVETHHSHRVVSQPVESSSDYYSSYESLPFLSSFSREGSLRLPKPQVTKEVFESLSDIGGSLRLPKRKSSLKSWGSFKHKRNMMF